MTVKKIVTLCLIALLVFSLTACGSNKEAAKEGSSASVTDVASDPTNPEGTVKIVFDAFKKKDVDTFDQYVKISIAGNSGLFWSDNKNELLTKSQDPEAVAIMSGFTEDFSYKILESKTNGNEATVKVQITNRDLSKVVNGLVAAGDTQGSDEAVLIQLINDAKGKTVTSEVELPVTKSGDKWTVTLDTGAMNAILGKIMSADWTSLIKDAAKNN